jgi:hypothetical protein
MVIFRIRRSIKRTLKTDKSSQSGLRLRTGNTAESKIGDSIVTLGIGTELSWLWLSLLKT